MIQRNILAVVFISAFMFASGADAGKTELSALYPAPYGEYKNLTSWEGANFATTSGSVGIGTATPGYKLDVKGNIVNSNPSQGYLGLTGDLPGFAVNTYPTLKTDGAYLYFSCGGAYSAHMSTGGVYTAVSDRNKKENFVEVDPQEILAKIDQLPMYRWNFKAEDPYRKHIAPVAQDFYALFGLGGHDDKRISHIDPSGVALVGIKALSKENLALAGETARLEKTVKELKAENDALKRESQMRIELLKKKIAELKKR